LLRSDDATVSLVNWTSTGTQKGASSFLFAALTEHPQILRPLTGSQYKEPGVYLPSYSPQRAEIYEARHQVFPYIEPDESFISSEGTVSYLPQSESAGLILKDNPDARIIFTLRDPVARAWSDFRFNYRGYYEGRNMSFGDVVTRSIQELKECMAANDYDKDVESFFSTCRTSYDDHFIVKLGIYYYPLRHWYNKWPSSSILVITSEDLAEREAETLASAVKFLGLCQYEFKDLDPQHVTGKLAREFFNTLMRASCHSLCRDIVICFVISWFQSKEAL